MITRFSQLPLLACASFAALLAKPPIPTPPDDSVVGAIEPYLFKKILNSKNPEDSIANHWNEKELRAIVEKNDVKLFGGPILGRVTSTSATFWLRATRPSRIEAVVSAIEASNRQASTAVASATASEKDDLTVRITVKNLKPFTDYNAIFTNDECDVLARASHPFRTSP